MQQAAVTPRADYYDSQTLPARFFAGTFPPIAEGVWWIRCHLVWAWQCIERWLADQRGGAPVRVVEGIIRTVRVGDAAFDVYQAMGLRVAQQARLDKWVDADDDLSSEMYYRVTPVVLELDDGRVIHFCEYQATSRPVPSNAPYFAGLAAGERVCAVGWWERDMFSAWGLRLRGGRRLQVVYASRPPRYLPRCFDELLARRPHGFAEGVGTWGRYTAAMIMLLVFVPLASGLDADDIGLVMGILAFSLTLLPLACILVGVTAMRMLAGPLRPIPEMMALGRFGEGNLRFRSYDFARCEREVRLAMEPPAQHTADLASGLPESD
ncbi:hypothetical protein [Ralstonia solanacearum]|uniref:hypothetical protein n=1 Tax=Ralstonia solanacearum TaxID=305 RepID=UPI0005ABEFC0|nr:hypothetical protein [Ralstonia solanacearum]